MRSEMIEEAAEKLRGILSRMAIEAEVRTREEDERMVLEVVGAEAALVIGKHGATLDALQYLLNKMSPWPAEGAERKPIVIDAEGYRGRRAESLVELAHRLAEKALKTKRPVSAAPMSPADRRVIHLALAGQPGITTRSEGEGAARRLVIIPDPQHEMGEGSASSQERPDER